MEKKLIINVGRQLGSGGRCIAKALSEEFNCQFYDKEILNLAARTTNREDFLNRTSMSIYRSWAITTSIKTIFHKKGFTNSKAM